MRLDKLKHVLHPEAHRILLNLAGLSDSPGGAGFSLRGASAPPSLNSYLR